MLGVAAAAGGDEVTGGTGGAEGTGRGSAAAAGDSSTVD